MSSEALGSASGPHLPPRFQPFGWLAPHCSAAPLAGRQSRLWKCVRERSRTSSFGAGFPSRAAFPAQVVSANGPPPEPLPSRLQPTCSPAARLPRHLPARAKLEMLGSRERPAIAPRLSRLRLPACRHPSRGNAPPPFSDPFASQLAATVGALVKSIRSKLNLANIRKLSVWSLT